MLIGHLGREKTSYGAYVSRFFCVLTVPGEPQDVKVSPINSTSIHVTWKPPQEKEKNGIIRGYHVHVQEVREEVRA